MKFLFSCITFLLISLQAFATTRTVFLQMFEWPWNDIAQECENYLGPAGFAAVQVSPPHENIIWQGNPWWERYQVASYKLESRSGNEKQFADMVRRCKAVGVDIYVDAVINHMTGIHSGTGLGGSKFDHYNYPGLFGYQDFHHCGRNGGDNIVNFDDRYELQFCELVGLADLATESDYVRGKIAEYLNHLLDLGVTGFRIDAAKHIPSSDLQAIFSRLKRSPYIYSEVIYSPTGPVQYSEYTPFGDVMAYAYGEIIANGIRSKNMDVLRHAADGFPASDKSVVFLTNHDLERGTSVLSYNGSENGLYKLAQVFLLSWPYGYPHLYTGYAFSDREAGPPLDQNLHTTSVFNRQGECRAPWTCEHRNREVAAMVDFRNQTDRSFTVYNWWSNDRDVLSFSRGNQGFVAINFSNQNYSADFSTALPDGTYCNILVANYNISSRSCSQGYQVSHGRVSINLAPQTAVVLLEKTDVLLGKKK
jgi:alpha-amylase